MTIARSIQSIQQRINESAKLYQRDPKSIQLIAVSKGQPIHAIKEAYAAGISQFGENYWQEAQEKIKNLQELSITWHFIGPLQSNKSKEVAHNFSWVHSLEREKIAQLLSSHRPLHLPPLNICIQVNLDDEKSKSGISPLELEHLVTVINQLPRIKLRGLMAIPHPEDSEEKQYQSLYRLSLLLKNINQGLNLNLDTLSMGMSEDLKPAIAAGSTLLRIGRAIFGERTNKDTKYEN